MTREEELQIEQELSGLMNKTAFDELMGNPMDMIEDLCEEIKEMK